MSKQTNNISCSLCESGYETEIETEGWATSKSGVALSVAIREYIEKYWV